MTTYTARSVLLLPLVSRLLSPALFRPSSAILRHLLCRNPPLPCQIYQHNLNLASVPAHRTKTSEK